MAVIRATTLFVERASFIAFMLRAIVAAWQSPLVDPNQMGIRRFKAAQGRYKPRYVALACMNAFLQAALIFVRKRLYFFQHEPLSKNNTSN
jgi:hypothetical protein